MNLCIAIDSFKGSLTSMQAAGVLEQSLRTELPDIQIRIVPMADGGEGTTEALLAVLGGEWVWVDTFDPLGRPIRAAYGWDPVRKWAIIETAAASGLPLLQPDERHPRQASSYGTGILIRHALDRGAERLIIGLGGSATVDGGIGLFQAVGVRYLDAEGEELPGNGSSLGQIQYIDVSSMNTRLLDVEIVAACDVRNPLLGAEGAVNVFGPQKGVAESELLSYERDMEHYAGCMAAATGYDRSEDPGSGAAGGIGFALNSLLDVEMKSGFQLIAEYSGLEQIISSSDAVITGEGRMDNQSAYGKVPMQIIDLANRAQVPVIAVAGQADRSINWEIEGFSAVYTLLEEAGRIELAMQDPERFLRKVAKKVSIFLRKKPQ